MNYNNFYYALSLLDTMYGIDMEDDDFAEIALVGWNLIGNKRTRLYRYSTCVDNCEQGVELPCNYDTIEAVTTGFEDWNYSTNDTPNGDLDSAYTEEYIEHRKGFRHPLYIPGKLIKYEQVGNKLYFDRPHGRINILYRGVILDDEDLPEITDKEAMALATYVAYVSKFKEAIKTNNQAIMASASAIKANWLLLCDQARVDYPMSQNDWNDILDAKTRWCRKSFGKSYKPV